jgi:phenylacetate-CoA ligase
MTVRVERRTEAGAAAAADAGARLALLIKNNIGVSIQVEVLEPDSVERSLGKMRRTIDTRPAGQ